MKIMITGATGFVGRSLCLQLQQLGHELVVLSRDPQRASAVLGNELEVVPMDDFDRALKDLLPTVDAVINLAGEPVVGRRWSAAQKSRLRTSRVDLTRKLVDLMASSPKPPAVLISASAVGFYGDRRGGMLDENQESGSGFLARLCADWEDEAQKATIFGTRVVMPRIGIVLGQGGGALESLLPAFRLGLGGRIGSGQQAMPWIHLRDLVRIIVVALSDHTMHGPINAVSPNPVSNLEFTKTLGRALRRPTKLPVPAGALRLLLGESASVLLSGQKAFPSKLIASGFRFQVPTLEDALDDLVRNNMGCEISKAGDIPSSAYLRKRKPIYELRQQTLLDAPITEVREFFSRAENLGLLTPPKVDFKITSAPIQEMETGSTISYTIKLGKLPIKWRTEIESWDPELGFVDVQVRGPYRSWWHQHRFYQQGTQTLMQDRVLYALPLGLVGRLAHRLMVSRMLIKIFSYRSRAIAFRFGKVHLARPPLPPSLRVAHAGPVAAAGQ